MNARPPAVIATRLVGLLLLLFGAAQLLGQVLPFIAILRWIDWRPRAILENLGGAGAAQLGGRAQRGTRSGWFW